MAWSAKGCKVLALLQRPTPFGCQHVRTSGDPRHHMHRSNMGLYLNDLLLRPHTWTNFHSLNDVVRLADRWACDWGFYERLMQEPCPLYFRVFCCAQFMYKRQGVLSRPLSAWQRCATPRNRPERALRGEHSS